MVGAGSVPTHPAPSTREVTARYTAPRAFWLAKYAALRARMM